MKSYQNREQLKEDVTFVKSILEYDPEYRNHIISILFNQWIDTSPDSPWYNEGSEEEMEAADTLIKINENGQSNEWSGKHTVFNEVEEESGKRKNQFYNLRYL